MTDKISMDNMTLAPGVVDTIISITVREQEGIASLGNPVASGFFSRLVNKPSTTGIESHYDEDGKLAIALHIYVNYGYVLPELAEKLRQAIADALRVQVGIEVSSVDIFIDGIQFTQN